MLNAHQLGGRPELREAARLDRDRLAVVSGRSLKSRVTAAAAEALARQGFVTPVDVCLGLGWLHATNVDDWRHGRVDDLEYFLPVHADRITELIVRLDSWASERGLERTEAEYISATRNRRPLRFFTGAPAVVEAEWRTRWVSRDLPAQKRARITKAQDSPPDLVVVQPVRDWTCVGCGGTGDLLIMDDAGPLCLACADMDHLVFLPSGEAALTRRAKKASGLMSGVSRAEARDLIRPAVDRILASWS
jgi:hypothetical protein